MLQTEFQPARTSLLHNKYYVQTNYLIKTLFSTNIYYIERLNFHRHTKQVHNVKLA